MTPRPPTDEELDVAARYVIQGLERIADRADLEADIASGRRSPNGTPTPPKCQLCGTPDPKAPSVTVVVELTPGRAGVLDLRLCGRHTVEALDVWNKRRKAAAPLELIGRRILAINPIPLNVEDLMGTPPNR